MNPIALFIVSIVLAVSSLVGLILLVRSKLLGFAAVVSLVLAFLLLWFVPYSYRAAGFDLVMANQCIAFLELARGWVFVTIFPIWLGILCYHAAGTTRVVDSHGAHAPALGATAHSQPVLASLIGVGIVVSVAWGVYLLVADYGTKPNQALVHLIEVAERSPLKENLKPQANPFAMTIPADLMDPQKVEQFQKDVLAELKKIGGYDAITNVKLVSVRHEAANNKHLTGAVVYFHPNDTPAGAFKDEVLWLYQDFILDEAATTQWATDATGYLQRSAPLATTVTGGATAGSYLPQPQGSLSSPATFSRVGKVPTK